MCKTLYVSILALIFISIPTNSPASTKHALLIGINDYEGTGLDSLDGAVNDIELIKKVLWERYGFEEKNIIVLKDKRARHKDIQNAFSKLGSVIQPGDFVYIHYSGHGSRAPNLNNDDEREGDDQTWVPYGARSGRFEGLDNYDILDDELNAWLRPIFQKTRQVVFVADSCHSSSVTRGDVVVRGGPSDVRKHPLEDKKYHSVKFKTGVRIGAARDDQQAGEGRFKNNRIHGLFTWHWANGMEQAGPGETWKDIFKKVRARVNHRNPSQQPQMQGSDDLPVFGGDFKPAPARILVSQVFNNGAMARIEAGFLSNVTIGSIYELYDPLGKTGRNSASIEITDVHPYHGIGKVDGVIRQDDLVVEALHNYEIEPINVFLNADFPLGADGPLLRKLRAMIQSNDLPEFDFSLDQEHAQMVLYILRPKCQNGMYVKLSPMDSLPRSFEGQPPQLWILNKFEQRMGNIPAIPMSDPASGLGTLRDTLKKTARVRELKQLASSRDPNVDLFVTVWEPVKKCMESHKNCLKFDDGSGRTFKKEGEYPFNELENAPLAFNHAITFTLKNRSEKDYYAYFIDIMDNGDINPIFPGPPDRVVDALIKTGKQRDFRFAPLVLDVEGGETVKLIVTENPIDVTLLLQHRSADTIDMTKLNPLERLLVNAAHGKRGGPEKNRISMHEWGALQHSFVIEK